MIRVIKAIAFFQDKKIFFEKKITIVHEIVPKTEKFIKTKRRMIS